MRHSTLPLLILAILSVSCSRALDARQQGLGTQRSAIHCDPDVAGALAARPTDLKTKPKGHIAVARLQLTEAKYVEGKCVDDIEWFTAGNARLASRQIFQVWDDGTVRLYPPQGLDADESVAVTQIPALPGYTLIETKSLGRRPHPLGKRRIYLGLFRGKSDSVIARFDMVEDKPSKTAEILIRATAPIRGLGFLGAPDTTEGGIGFVQHAGPNKAWLYSYSWQHGPFHPLKF
jgi:hypothetical protein